tara:strand:- start:6614 stop:9055 length:2442 start_codon:yes stop_codon:yes gene_type:complete
MLKQLKYIDVIVPLSVEGTFQYSVEYDMDILVGQRVIVQFGSRKLYTAIVANISSKKNNNYRIKNIQSLIDEPPIVNQFQIDLWKWISKYYMCYLGEVMNTALPSSLKLASESKLMVNPDFNNNFSSFSKDEASVLDLISKSRLLSIHDLNKQLDNKFSFSVINHLIKENVLIVHEYLNDKYKNRFISKVSLSKINFKDIPKLTSKQEKLLGMLFEFSKNSNNNFSLASLIQNTGFSRSIFRSLEKKSLININDEKQSRLNIQNIETYPIHKLSDAQELSFNSINKKLLNRDVCLLHGVTSSGKTEIYIKLIEQELKKGRQVLYLLPEIALTIQIIKRLKKHFGNLVGVSHSNLNNSERVEVWKSVHNESSADNQFSIILGARSSLFLPYNNLGLIIIDEEHDPSYKQQQPSPRYHARDSAIYLATIHNAKVLLGSATPSMESYYNARNDKYGFVELHTRYSDIKLPKINTIDIRKGYLKKEMQGFFSNELINEISVQLNKNKQIILFQNRRGYSKVLSCNSCGQSVSCKYCSVSLTFHKLNNNLRCHYCGYIAFIPKSCGNCDGINFHNKGFGTEQIAEALSIIFPEYIIKRMDYDTTRKKNAYQDIIEDFQQLKINILVGTQMIAKGFDFENVSLVGIIDADNMLNFPDFRSHERAFQLMSQVSGRAGRKGNQGIVVLQTYNPDQEIINHVKSHSFSKFYNLQLRERAIFNYPPFSRLIIIKFRHTDHFVVDSVSEIFASIMKESFKHRVLGPEYPIVSKVRNYFIKNVLLKVELGKSFSKAKEIISAIIKHMKENKILNRCVVQIDIDPN